MTFRQWLRNRNEELYAEVFVTMSRKIGRPVTPFIVGSVDLPFLNGMPKKKKRKKKKKH